MEKTREFDMIPEVSKYLFENGATLIVTDVPPGTNFGIDLKSWNTGPKFKGIKMIPPGIHFIHYSEADEFGGESVCRTGYFYNFNLKEVVVKKWNHTAEEVSTEDVEEEIAGRYKANLHNLDEFLGPYPYDIYKHWQQLTNKIDKSLIDRCHPACGLIRSALELENCADVNRPRPSDVQLNRRITGELTEEKEKLLLPQLKPKPGVELRLTELPDRNYPENSTPTEVTQHSLDSTWALNLVLNKMKEPMEIIGELQFAFICFLIGQSLEAFEHWKKIAGLICGADKAIVERRYIYIEFLRNIEIQLSHAPHDLLCDIVASNNFIYQNLRKLFGTIEMNPDVDGRLKSEALRIRSRLQSKFMWEFTDVLDEPPDEKPVVITE